MKSPQRFIRLILGHQLHIPTQSPTITHLIIPILIIMLGCQTRTPTAIQDKLVPIFQNFTSQHRCRIRRRLCLIHAEPVWAAWVLKRLVQAGVMRG